MFDFHLLRYNSPNSLEIRKRLPRKMTRVNEKRPDVLHVCDQSQPLSSHGEEKNAFIPRLCIIARQ